MYIGDVPSAAVRILFLRIEMILREQSTEDTGL